MLLEMGVRVWLPAAPVELTVPARAPLATPGGSTNAITTVANEAVPTRATTVNSPKSQRETEIEATSSAGGVAADLARQDWPALGHAIATCEACPLCIGRRAAVWAAPDAPQLADWLIVGEPPDEAEERAGAPFAGPTGLLLDNMLKALGLSRGRADSAAPATPSAQLAYVTHVVKCRPAPARNPDLQELATCENHLRREVALVQPKVILALGRFAAQGLLQASVAGVAATPLGQMRGQSYHYQGIPVIVSYPLSYLLRSPQYKASAWLDLCQAQAALRRGA